MHLKISLIQVFIILKSLFKYCSGNLESFQVRPIISDYKTSRFRQSSHFSKEILLIDDLTDKTVTRKYFEKAFPETAPVSDLNSTDLTSLLRTPGFKQVSQIEEPSKRRQFKLNTIFEKKRPEAPSEKYPHLVFYAEIESDRSEQWVEFFRKYLVEEFYKFCLKFHEFSEFEQLLDGIILHLLAEAQIPQNFRFGPEEKVTLRIFATVATKDKVISIGLNKPKHFVYAQLASPNSPDTKLVTWGNTSLFYRNLHQSRKYFKVDLKETLTLLSSDLPGSLKDMLKKIDKGREKRLFHFEDRMKGYSLEELNQEYKKYKDSLESFEQSILTCPGMEEYFKLSDWHNLDFEKDLEKLKRDYRLLLSSETLREVDKRRIKTSIMTDLEILEFAVSLKGAKKVFSERVFTNQEIFLIDFILESLPIVFSGKLDDDIIGLNLARRSLLRSIFQLNEYISDLERNILPFSLENWMPLSTSGEFIRKTHYDFNLLHEQLLFFEKLTEEVSMSSINVSLCLKAMAIKTIIKYDYGPIFELTENDELALITSLDSFYIKAEEIKERLNLKWVKELDPEYFWGKRTLEVESPCFSEKVSVDIAARKVGNEKAPVEEFPRYMNKMWILLNESYLTNKKIPHWIKLEGVFFCLFENSSFLVQEKRWAKGRIEKLLANLELEDEEKIEVESNLEKLTEGFGKEAISLFKIKEINILDKEVAGQLMEPLFHFFYSSNKITFEMTFGSIENNNLVEIKSYLDNLVKKIKKGIHPALIIMPFSTNLMNRLRVKLFKEHNRTYLEYLKNTQKKLYKKAFEDFSREGQDVDDCRVISKYEKLIKEREKTVKDEELEHFSQKISNKSLRDLVYPRDIEITCFYKRELRNHPVFGVFSSDFGKIVDDFELNSFFFSSLREDEELNEAFKKFLGNKWDEKRIDAS